MFYYVHISGIVFILAATRFLKSFQLIKPSLLDFYLEPVEKIYNKKRDCYTRSLKIKTVYRGTRNFQKWVMARNSRAAMQVLDFSIPCQII